MSNLKEYQFSKLYEMGSGISSTKQQAGHGCPFLSFSTIFNNYFLPDELPDLMDTSVDEQEKYSVKKGDIFLTRTSETLDELAMSSVAVKDYPKATFSGFAKRLRPLQNDITYDKFMAFYLRSTYFRKIIDSNAVMTLRASFNEDIFSYLKLPLIKYDEQVKIGDFLFDIEEKIKINNKINTDLKEMAKTIFDYWFVQFEFPNKEGKSYKSSGGEMVWNKDLKREIPKGWSSRTIKKCVDKISTGLNPRKNFVLGKGNNSYVTIKNIEYDKIDFSKCDKIDDAALKIINNRSNLKKGDVLYTSIEPIGRTYLLKENPNNWDINESVFSIRTNENIFSKEYLYLLLNNEWFRSIAYTLSTGSVQKGIRISALESIIVAVPQKKIINEFTRIVEPIIEKIGNIENENKELIKLRDLLIPLLMNGQAKFKDN